MTEPASLALGWSPWMETHPPLELLLLKNFGLDHIIIYTWRSSVSITRANTFDRKSLPSESLFSPGRLSLSQLCCPFGCTSFFSVSWVCFDRKPLSPYSWFGTRTLFLTPDLPFMTGNLSELFMTGTLASNIWMIISEVTFSFSITLVIIYDFKSYFSIYWVLIFVGTGQRKVFSCKRISEKRLLLLHWLS